MMKINLSHEWKRGIVISIVAILIWVFIFALAGVGIGSDVSLTFSDAYNQYLPFHAEFRELLLAGDWNQFLYHWNLGFGGSFFGVYGYYLSSPFALLSLFFEANQLTSYFYWVILIKVGLAGFGSYLFLRHQPKVTTQQAMLFSVLYACIGALMDRFYNVMWLDAIWILPITIWMLQRLIHQKRWKGFLVCLIYLFWSNFYMAYMVGLFCFIWFLIEIFLYHQGTIKEKWRRFSIFVGCAGLAAMICGVLLLPTFLFLQENSYSQGISFEATHHLIQSLSDFYVGSYNGLAENAPGNIYITLFGLLASLSFFCHPTIQKKERCVFFGVVAFFFLSFSCPILDWMWHAFKMPKGFPNRYAFLLSFLLLYLGSRSFSLASELDPEQKRQWVRRSVGYSLFVTLVVLISTCIEGLGLDGIIDFPMMLINLVWLVGYGFLFNMWQQERNKQGIWMKLILVFVGLELLLNGFMTVYQLKTTQYSWRESDSIHYREIQEALEGLERDVFERVFLPEQGLNASLLHHIPTIENYNTLGHRQINGLLKMLTFGSTLEAPIIETKNEFFKTTPSLLLDSLFGLSYYYRPLLNTELMGKLNWLEVVDDQWLKNPYALPLGFAIDSCVLNVSLKDKWTHSPFENQERFLNLLLGNQLNSSEYLKFTYSWEVELIDVENLERETFSNKYAKIDLNQDSWMTLKVTPPKLEKELPLYLSFDTNTKHEVWMNDELLMKMGDGYVFDSFSMEEPFYLKIKLDQKDDARFSPLQIASIDEEVVIQMLEQLRANSLEDWEVDGNQLEIQLNLEESNDYWLSIPYSPNWIAAINGEEVELYSIEDCFVAIELPKGSYLLSLRYEVPGLKLGAMMSGLGLLFMGGICLYSKRSDQKKRG